ncbi:MAG TPA: glycosyltransferase, partial [Gemmatimonadaceae bacterium]|nr:glycosyltransferase [Gemmatimonadaceae bacterium]
ATDIYSNAFKLRRMMREGSIDMLFMLGGEQQEYAAEQGYESWRYDYGYHPSFGQLLGGERDVDVLFLGETRPRRRRALLNRLREQGVNVLVRGSWNDREAGLWGEERTRFLNRTKILVHLQRYPGKLAGKRFILGMANGAMVISEPVYRPEPFVDGEHYVSATIEKMPEVIRHFLANPAERERIAQAGHRFITRDLTFTRVMEEVLSVVDERLAERQR